VRYRACIGRNPEPFARSQSLKIIDVINPSLLG
jgi:hypothetical protein